jgi:hypothetical protein
VLVVVTTIGIVCGFDPRLGMVLSAYIMAILGVLMVRHGAKTNVDAYITIGAVIATLGWMIGSLVLAAMANTFHL